MIINPGINAYALNSDEIGYLERGLGGIFSNPEIRCLLSYSMNNNCVYGVSDIDLFAISENTLTDKEVFMKMGSDIKNLYESFGYTEGFPKGIDIDMTVNDLPLLENHGFTSFDSHFMGVFEQGKLLAGSYPETLEISKYADRGLVHLAKNLSVLRRFPLVKGLMERFSGREQLADAKWGYLIKIVDSPYEVSRYLSGNGKPMNRQEAVEFAEMTFGHSKVNPIKILSKVKKSHRSKMDFLESSESDHLLSEGISALETIISEMYEMRPHRPPS